MPKISIVVPVYKVEAYLRTCVRSLTAQTYPNIEIILVDDGSPDRCGELCDQLAGEDSRIVVIHQKNQGLSCARNTGARAARGDYLCFVDSDDLVMPTYCEDLLRALDGTDCDFSVCGACRFEDGSDPAPQNQNESDQVISNRQFLQYQFEHKTEFGVWNKLFRRELFETMQFAPGKIHEDVIFSADLARNLHHGIAWVGKELYLYRQRSGGIVSTQAKRCSPDRVYAGEYLMHAVRDTYPELLNLALDYAISYPFMFVDPIYVHRTFKQNKNFLDVLQVYLRQNLAAYEQHHIFSEIMTSRMKLFAKSRFFYGWNAYIRLARVYFYRMIRKDAYQDGHGI